MKVTNVAVKLINKGSFRGIATIILDDELVINDIRIIKAVSTEKLFIDFPKNSYAIKKGAATIAPLKQTTRDKIENAILKEYIKEMSKSNEFITFYYGF